MAAILKFPQGIVEILLRVATAILALIAVATAAAAIAIANNDDEDAFRAAEAIADNPFFPDSVRDEAQDFVDLRDQTYGSAGFVVAIGVLALLTQIAMIVVRFVNLTNFNTTFTIASVVLSFFFGAGLLAGGIAMAVFAADYDDFTDQATGDIQDEIEMIRDTLAASSAFSLLGMIAFLLLGGWMILFYIFKWNDKLTADPM